MSRFRCAVCGKIYEGEINTPNLSCECGSTIFYKERPNVKRVFTSD
ncbi:MAG: DNA-directed RNA polymerase subunit P [Thermoplasmata archaeon]|jgi:DNA-directed RNA polymerase subunit RPC12/RpoP|nr:DNA-directed RNA polymerase subunit P [Thermoplasmata archaeon]MVT14231.1 DNA-directed RNA polymerase subunit P [Euryarchaeota archaeon]MVT35912.1 DNA-directed RNA polymerase subunit P [Euryarchaeota archaeon]PMP75085.1 MAG: DNA-directed RNA polymerase subunit P [Aciduliprofundum sp.]HEU12951.1 DNA-directed RNA polymerase subunit P [Euryarchaeota archaeon]